jgi:hypothetical protein
MSQMQYRCTGLWFCYQPQKLQGYYCIWSEEPDNRTANDNATSAVYSWPRCPITYDLRTWNILRAHIINIQLSMYNVKILHLMVLQDYSSISESTERTSIRCYMKYRTKLSGEFYLGPYWPSVTAYMTLAHNFADFFTCSSSCSASHSTGTVFPSQG